MRGTPTGTLNGDASAESAAQRFAWRYAVALALTALLWLCIWYLDTAYSMVSIWARSDTFAHGFLIVPISAWLIWRMRQQLFTLVPESRFLALVPLSVAGFGWLLGHLANVGAVQQYAVVLMIPLLVWATLGDSVVRALAFPLSFLLLAVPTGEFLQPMLMEHTADFLVLALRATGIPVYRDGLFITIPSGNWSVVEACSGLRYLIASMTLGILYSYLTYRSLSRRVLFVAASLIVPIVANWLRAYMIVMIGHLSGMKYAVGVDHLIYGWLFFGIVMLVLFWVGSIWREDTDEAVAFTAPARTADRPVALGSILTATLVAAALVSIWPLMATLSRPAGPAVSPALKAPAPVGNWQSVDPTLASWKPRFVNPRAEVFQSYADGKARVALYIGYYRHQWQDSQLISSQNSLASATSGEWLVSVEALRPIRVSDDEFALAETQLRNNTGNLLVWRWYWVDGRFTANRYLAKLLQAKANLTGGGDDGAVVVVYASLDQSRERTAETLRHFVESMSPAIKSGLQSARDARAGSHKP